LYLIGKGFLGIFLPGQGLMCRQIRRRRGGGFLRPPLPVYRPGKGGRRISGEGGKGAGRERPEIFAGLNDKDFIADAEFLKKLYGGRAYIETLKSKAEELGLDKSTYVGILRAKAEEIGLNTKELGLDNEKQS
jgi:hypothetical protein